MNDLLSKKRKSSSSLLVAAGFLIVFGAVAFGKEFSGLFQGTAESNPAAPPPTPASLQPPKDLPLAPEKTAEELEGLPLDEMPTDESNGQAMIPGGMVRTDVGIGGISHAGDAIPGMPEPNPNSTPDDKTFIEPSETPAEVKALIAQMEEQAKQPPQELPEDLRRQLSQPPPELPEDLKAQLAAPPPEIPDDIKRALLEPPKIVSIDEVNKFPEPVNSPTGTQATSSSSSGQATGKR